MLLIRLVIQKSCSPSDVYLSGYFNKTVTLLRREGTKMLSPRIAPKKSKAQCKRVAKNQKSVTVII